MEGEIIGEDRKNLRNEYGQNTFYDIFIKKIKLHKNKMKNKSFEQNKNIFKTE